MSTLEIPYYKFTKPSNGEIVAVILTEHKEAYISGKLTEYPCEIFLNYSDVTKKRKVNTWNKVAPLNKRIFARVDDAEYAKDIVQISLSYIYDNAKVTEEELENQFVKNNLILSMFKKISFLSKVNLNELWSNIMYTVDDKRRNDYDDDMPCLFDYCNEEREFIKSIFEEKGYQDWYDKFIEELDNHIREKPYKIVSHVEIISNGGVKNSSEVIRKALDRINYEYTMKYSAAPTFYFETKSTDSSEDDHKRFVKFLEEEGAKLNPKTFVRCQKTIKHGAA